MPRLWLTCLRQCYQDSDKSKRAVPSWCMTLVTKDQKCAVIDFSETAIRMLEQLSEALFSEASLSEVLLSASYTSLAVIQPTNRMRGGTTGLCMSIMVKTR